MAHLALLQETEKKKHPTGLTKFSYYNLHSLVSFSFSPSCYLFLCYFLFTFLFPSHIFLFHTFLSFSLPSPSPFLCLTFLLLFLSFSWFLIYISYPFTFHLPSTIFLRSCSIPFLPFSFFPCFLSFCILVPSFPNIHDGDDRVANLNAAFLPPRSRGHSEGDSGQRSSEREAGEVSLEEGELSEDELEKKRAQLMKELENIN